MMSIQAVGVRRPMARGVVMAAVLAAGLAPMAGCSTLGTGGEVAPAGDVVSRAVIDSAVRRVKPALVRIKVISSDYSDGRESKEVSFGSGTIITPEGHVVTNHHVAGRALHLVVTLTDQREVPAVLVGTDPATDIAVIRLTPATPEVFPTAAFGDSSRIRVGDPVLALGSPLSISQSVTLGILSNDMMITPPSFGGYKFELDGEDVGELVRWLGHDAAIFPGNSGGPLVNLAGEIIGVNEIGMGLGGAIPGNLARAVADELIARGHVRRAWVGVELQPRLKSDISGQGVLVGSVQAESPAMAAGLQPGDVLLSIGGVALSARVAEELPAVNNVLAGLTIDSPTTAVVRRGESTIELTVTPAMRQPALLPYFELPEWGIAAQDLSVWNNLGAGRPGRRGAMVSAVRSGGQAAKAKPELRRGDVITAVDGQPVERLDDLKARTAALVPGREGVFRPVLVEFEREGEQLMAVVELGIDAIQPASREVRKGWLPFETQVMTTEIARQLDRVGTRGVRVTRVYNDIPAGFPIKVGDIITHVDGDPVEASRPVDTEVFRTMVRQYDAGTEIELTVLRGGETIRPTVTVQANPAAPREVARHRDRLFEFVAREATFSDREKPTLAGAEFGVVVDSVPNGGWASVGGLQVGDALLAVGGQPVPTLEALATALDALHQSRPPQVVFQVRRGTSTKFLEIEPAW